MALDCSSAEMPTSRDNPISRLENEICSLLSRSTEDDAVLEFKKQRLAEAEARMVEEREREYKRNQEREEREYKRNQEREEREYERKRQGAQRSLSVHLVLH